MTKRERSKQMVLCDDEEWVGQVGRSLGQLRGGLLRGGSGVGCSWRSDWLKGGSFTGSMTMKNGSAEWDGSSFIGVG